MKMADDKYVFHGSMVKFDMAIPKRQKRSKVGLDGKDLITFDEVSFHATAYKWIAMSYVYEPQIVQIKGNSYKYRVGVSLYDYREEIYIFGLDTLEKSLEILYGQGGYLMTFDKDSFFHMEGLGDLEVITKDPLAPIKVEEISDPVAELKKMGIKFNFIDMEKVDY